METDNRRAMTASPHWPLLGIPELFTLIAAAVMGKQGFDNLKRWIKGVLGSFSESTALRIP